MKILHNLSSLKPFVFPQIVSIHLTAMNTLIHVDIFTVKRRLRDYRREMDHRTTVNIEPGLRGRSGRVVVTAIIM